MAVCEIWDVRGRLDHPIDYAENPEKTANPKYTESNLQALGDVMKYATNGGKTEKQFFVTGVNCDPATARHEMLIAKEQWQDESEIVCYHGYQSFKQGECHDGQGVLTAEQAHKVGVKLAEKMWGERFQLIVATTSIQTVCTITLLSTPYPLQTASTITTTKPICDYFVSVPMSFAERIRCPSLNTQAAGKSPTLSIKPRSRAYPQGTAWQGRRLTKPSAKPLR